MSIVGHGIDLVEVVRIRAMLDEHGQRFLDRCFTPDEQAHKAESRRRIEHLAARFAAKEAVLKALGTGLTGGINWTDIEVVNGASGAPSLALHGTAKSAAAELGVTSWLVSLTHTDSLAMASVIALGKPG
ncbi:MAG: holo-ACP synthase [Phycisphaeraceae bacterium]|nr:holo-ACP synthase [Phycisphaeraceae bacterium]